MDMMFYAFAIFVFVAVALAIEAGWRWWTMTYSAAARRTSRRLHSIGSADVDGPSRESLLKRRGLAESVAGDRMLRRVPGLVSLDRLLEQSGSKWVVSGLLTYVLICVLVAGLFALLLPDFALLIAGAGLTGVLLPYVIVLRKRQARLIRLERQLPEAADLIARSLRAGHAFSSTLQMVADEMPEPIAGEFRIVADEINYGVAMQDAFHKMAARIPLADVRYLIVAILIQRETGGNLAELMNNISLLIRQRLRLLGQIRALSAEGKLSAWILGLLPFAVALMLAMVNPDYIGRLITDPDGFQLLAIAGGLMLVGILWMRKIIRIHI